MPDTGRYGWTAAGIRRHGAAAGIRRDLNRGRTSNLRSIPPRTSTGVSPGFSQREYGAISPGGNTRRPIPAAPEPALSLAKGPVASFIPETVQPIVDIFDEGDCLVIIAEIPGAEEHSIGVEIEDHALKLRAAGRYKEYRGEIGLPAAVIGGSLAWTLNNGIIDVRLRRKKARAISRR